MKKVRKDRTEWFNSEGQRHRLDGPAAELSDGYKAYYVDGKLHRIDGPAVEYLGDKAYYVEGKLHRTDGPAVEYSNGDKAYYVEGIEMTEDEFVRQNEVKELSVQEISIEQKTINYEPITITLNTSEVAIAMWELMCTLELKYDDTTNNMIHEILDSFTMNKIQVPLTQKELDNI